MDRLISRVATQAAIRQPRSQVLSLAQETGKKSPGKKDCRKYVILRKYVTVNKLLINVAMKLSNGAIHG